MSLEKSSLMLVVIASNSVVVPLQVRSNSLVPPLSHRLCTDFAPTLHRLWYGGRAKEERRGNGRKALPKMAILVNNC